jgi:hypothetical protein
MPNFALKALTLSAWPIALAVLIINAPDGIFGTLCIIPALMY